MNSKGNDCQYSQSKNFYLSNGSIYSKTNDLIVKLDLADRFAFIFFNQNNKDYAIASLCNNKYCIVDCNIGHVEEGENPLIWDQIWQVDAQTICIKVHLYCGTPAVYQFYHFSRFGLDKMEVVQIDGSPLPKSDFLLTDNELVDDRFIYPEPDIGENGLIKFRVYEQRALGLCLRNNDNALEEIDMEIHDYYKQADLPSGFKLGFIYEKTYQIDIARMYFQRRGNKMVLCLFWIKDENHEFKIPTTSKMFEKIIQQLNNKSIFYYNICQVVVSGQNKYVIYVYPKENWRLIRHYYSIEFMEDDSVPYIMHLNHIKHKDVKKIITTWNEKTIVDLMD